MPEHPSLKTSTPFKELSQLDHRIIACVSLKGNWGQRSGLSKATQGLIPVASLELQCFPFPGSDGSQLYSSRSNPFSPAERVRAVGRDDSETFSLLPFLAHRQQNEVPPQEELSSFPRNRVQCLAEPGSWGAGPAWDSLGCCGCSAPTDPTLQASPPLPSQYPRILFVNNLL